MQKEFYVHQNGENKGPYSKETIIELIEAQEFSSDDSIYIDEKKEWILLKDFEPLKAYFKAKTNKIKTKVSDDLKNQEWYILKWDNKYGPFSYLEIVKMLQGKSIFEFDYVWKQGVESWVRIADVSEFNPEKIKNLYKNSEDPNIKDIFFRRRHDRKNFNGSIIIHDNDKVWKGSAIEISEGGAGIIMNNSMIQPGDKVFLHFKPGDKVPPFNAICEVISKKFAKGVNDRYAPVKYGIKFIKIHENDLEAIQKYIKKAA